MHLLIVEDEPELREIYHWNLTGQGHNVMLAENGNRAMEILERVRPEAIITDLLMPNGNGLKIIMEAKRLDIPLIVISAFPSAYEACVPEGTMMLQKGDFPIEVLPSIVEITLRREQTSRAQVVQVMTG